MEAAAPDKNTPGTEVNARLVFNLISNAVSKDANVEECRALLME